MNHLYFGDNLAVIRASIASESIDLIYLDPPFNSKRDYNLLFKSPRGSRAKRRSRPLKIRGIGASKQNWNSTSCSISQTQT